jgi:hypothetical protein
MWERLTDRLRAVIGDDGTGPLWQRLTPDGRAVLRLAFVEARELGHPCLADEHVLLGLLRHGTGPATALLHARGLDLAAARAELLRLGPTLGSRADPADALRAFGIEVEDVRRRLESTFGADALAAAERRVRRRPRWRGGHPRPSPLCVYLLARRSFRIAARFADRRGDTGIGPEHLLYGVLQDARDPVGTQLGPRSRRRLARLGWIPGRPNPLRLLLEARGLDLSRLTTELGGAS